MVDKDKECSMVQELTDRYHVEQSEEGKFKISILAPAKYRGLWMHKLSDLRTTMKEIEYYEND